MAISRRQLIALAGAGVATGTAGVLVTNASPDAAPAANLSAAIPFNGPHQAGITTEAQDRLHFASFEVTTTDRSQLQKLLQDWTSAARQMTTGQELGVGSFTGPGLAPPQDTGEAAGLVASGLTLTIGFGPSLFDHPKLGDRFGLASRKPALLADLPHFPADSLDPNRSGGDLCIQACAHDPMVAAHAIRNLARIGFGVTALRWAQLGFGRTSSTTDSQVTARNLFGQKDGTSNVRAHETQALAEHIWVQSADAPGQSSWLTGGSFMVTRRIKMRIETWDRTSLDEQEQIIGRTKGTGAPLTGGGEFDPPDFSAKTPDGTPIIGENAHIRLAHPAQHGGQRILRRGYNYIEGADSLGNMEAGLFFISYQRNPQQFINIQKNLARHDVLNEYIQHTGSGVWACPPGLSDSQTWADHLFS